MKDFVDAVPGSSGARLAAWLQPESRLDPNKCELKVIEEPVRFGWPTQLTVITRDQYGDAVYVPNLKIQIKASPSVNGLNGNRKGKRLSQVDAFVCRGVAMPPRIPYEAMVKDGMCFKAIAFMKVSCHSHVEAFTRGYQFTVQSPSPTSHTRSKNCATAIHRRVKFRKCCRPPIRVNFRTVQFGRRMRSDIFHWSYLSMALHWKK